MLFTAVTMTTITMTTSSLLLDCSTQKKKLRKEEVTFLFHDFIKSNQERADDFVWWSL